MSGILDVLGSGLPVLVLQFATTLALLGIGAAIYMALTPFHERELIAAGNTAAGIAAKPTKLTSGQTAQSLIQVVRKVLFTSVTAFGMSSASKCAQSARKSPSPCVAKNI